MLKGIRALSTIGMTVALAGTLIGCTTGASSLSSQDDASLNRQYMSQINQQTEDMSVIMSDFSVAVANDDAVTMNAKITELEKAIDTVKAGQPTEALSDVKDAYVDGMCTTKDALKQYTQLYSDLKAGTIDTATFNEQLGAVQEAYNNGLQKLQEADALLNSKEPESSSSSSEA